MTIFNARIKDHLMANCERNSSRLRCWININASCMGPTITCSVISPFYNVSPITRSVSNTHLKKEIRYLLDWFPVIGQVLAIHMNNKKSILNMHNAYRNRIWDRCVEGFKRKDMIPSISTGKGFSNCYTIFGTIMSLLITNY